MAHNRVVIINGYAGSLTVAATAGGYQILASLEDHGYGLDAQRANFPHLTYVDALPWPYANLSGCMVIAHPPCAAFSAQNNSANKGTSSTHFDCTRRVVDYAAQGQADAIMVESVTGAYEGARAFYDEWSAAHHYNLYRVLQNACTFGVPQWRPRYWTVLIRRDACIHPLGYFILKHTRKYMTLGEALGAGIPGPANEYTERYWARQVEGLKRGGMSGEQISTLVNDSSGHLGRVLAELCELDIQAAKQKFSISSFDSHVFTMLPVDGFAHTVMCVSNWLWLGRPVNMPEMNVIAGFPADYKFPRPREQKCYLSKGVAPPVARWLLDQVRDNLDGAVDLERGQFQHLYILKPGETADLRVKRAQALERELFR
jgi:site-specific DNA-cytosine methylase